MCRAPSGEGDILGGGLGSIVHFTDEEIGAQEILRTCPGHSEYVAEQDLNLECLLPVTLLL